jgi:tetratricopeptide (TPR) repeat protein
MKKTLFLIGTAGILGLALFAAILLFARTSALDGEALTAADNLLAAGHTHEAIDVYEQLIIQGQESSALYYNLGNAFYQQGNLPAAYQAFQQAANLSPRDADIRHNLELAQSELGAGEPSDLLPHWLAVNELALLSLAAWFLLAFLLIWLPMVKSGRGKRLLRAAIVVALLFTLTSGALLTSRMVSASFPTTPLTGMADQT